MLAVGLAISSKSIILDFRPEPNASRFDENGDNLRFYSILVGETF